MLTDVVKGLTGMMGGAPPSLSAVSSDSNSKYIMYALVAVAFLAVSYWAYTTYVGPLFSDFNLNVKQGSSKTQNEDGSQDMSSAPTT